MVQLNIRNGCIRFSSQLVYSPHSAATQNVTFAEFRIFSSISSQKKISKLLFHLDFVNHEWIGIKYDAVTMPIYRICLFPIVGYE